MITENTLSSTDFERFTVKIHEPFAEFLLADRREIDFEISLLDVVRFAGHACPSMIGAFLISQRAIKELFPETNICVRGQVAIELSGGVSQGATGPISNVFSMIFGAWENSGFGGLQGQFVRRGLLHYDSKQVPPGHFRFRNLESGRQVDIAYDHSKATPTTGTETLPFQKLWRMKISRILAAPADYVRVAASVNGLKENLDR